MASNNNSQYVINFVKRRKTNLISVFGGKCCICGFDEFQEALEFHHINPEEKAFSLSSNVMKSLDAQLKEARKCILVCANCHRGIHSGFRQVPDNWKETFSEDRAKELLEKNNAIKTHQIKHCVRCGKEIDHSSTYCSECASFISRKVDRPSREVLKNEIRCIPFTQIAQKYQVSDNAIRKWCDSYNLPRKVSDIKKYSDIEWQKI